LKRFVGFPANEPVRLRVFVFPKGSVPINEELTTSSLAIISVVDISSPNLD
jgi:hypothetical protein